MSSGDARQREWIWEFFLKNCKDARMIQELMNALPFPNENLDLKRMLLLRSLSLQISAGIVDEFTLDILRGLGELCRVSGGSRREGHSVDFRCQEIAKRRKVDRSNDTEAALSVDAHNSCTPQVKEGRAAISCSEEGRESGMDARKADTTVGIRDWMKGRALPRTVGGDSASENVINENSLSKEVTMGTPHGTEGRDLPGVELPFRPGQSATQWELELAVMLELAVKFLRGDSPDRKSFEHAVTKYWGDSQDDSDAGAVEDNREKIRMRDQIKSELLMVRKNPELLDDIVKKYTKSRVEDILKSYLDKAWASTGQTFLERVSADVVNGKYKPVNCNGQRPSKKAGSSPVDGDAGQHSNVQVDTSEKPWVRASRGRYSRSREKLQKNFAIWQLKDVDGGVAGPKPPTADERAKVGAEPGAEQPLGAAGPKCLDQSLRDGDRGKQNNKVVEGGDASPSLPTERGFEINARLARFDGSVARVLEFEEPTAPELEDGKQLCQEDKDKVETGDQPDGPETVSVGDDEITAPEIAEAPGASDAVHLSEEKEEPTADDEKKVKETRSAQSAGWLGADPGSPHKVVNKENLVPPSSPKPVDPIPAVCFSPPPWVEGSPAVPVAEGTRKRKPGSLQDQTAARREDEPRNIESAAAGTTCSSQSPDILSTRRNLGRKQRILDASVQDPLPKILATSRTRGSLLERSATARTVEWDDDDDIEESPSSSPSASRHVRLPIPTVGRKISPLTGSKAAGNVYSKRTRRAPNKWTEKEVETLKQEVGKYGKGRWKFILERNLDTFPRRTEVDLKDKWRNLERFEGVTD